MTTTPKVLIVEDEGLIALAMEDLLGDLGCEVVGSFGAVQPALDWLSDQGEPIDGALLDVNLGGEMVYPVAEALRARDIPFAFATGYGVLPGSGAGFGAPMISKPLNLDKLAPIVALFAKDH